MSVFGDISIYIYLFSLRVKGMLWLSASPSPRKGLFREQL